jgi:hypothetical protein
MNWKWNTERKVFLKWCALEFRKRQKISQTLYGTPFRKYVQSLKYAQSPEELSQRTIMTITSMINSLYYANKVDEKASLLPKIKSVQIVCGTPSPPPHSEKNP